jgi:hypothetical protein
MTHEEIIDFIFKYSSFAITAMGFLFALHKFTMRNIEKKFEQQHSLIKIEMQNLYNGTVKTLQARLDYLQEDAVKIGCIVGTNVAENKQLCESVARLEASCQAMQRTCEINHAPWNGEERRISSRRA